LRTEEAGSAASKIARPVPKVREALLDKQRAFSVARRYWVAGRARYGFGGISGFSAEDISDRQAEARGRAPVYSS